MSTTDARRRCARARGTLTEPGRNSPYRDRGVDENLDLFRRMRAGEFPNGARVLRAKIDMASGNINLRDPVLYRILHARTRAPATAWCIYPTYDFAHGQSDAIEGVTHSICTLEFEDHRPLYDWLIEQSAGAVAAAAIRVRPAQPHLYGAVEALPDRAGARRPCHRLGRSAHADARRTAAARRAGRGDPRFRQARSASPGPTASSTSPMFEHAVREDLNRPPQRRMAVLRPLKLVIENYPEGQSEELMRSTTPTIRRRHPQDPFRPRALRRARRFHGGSAEEFLPPGARRARCGCAMPIS